MLLVSVLLFGKQYQLRTVYIHAFIQGSWKLQLRQKFKNMRREPGKKQDKESEDKDHAEPLATPPPAKKQRKHGDADHPSPPSDSGTQYTCTLL